MSCRVPIALPQILVHPTSNPASPMSPLSLPRGVQLFARGGKPGPALLKAAQCQCNIRSRIRPAIPLSSLLSAPKFSLDFHAAQLSYQPPLLSLNFSHESPIPICKILSRRYLSAMRAAFSPSAPPHARDADSLDSVAFQH